MKNRSTFEPKTCAYCGDPGSSREHYFPQWMHPWLRTLPQEMFRSTDTRFQDEAGRVDHGSMTQRLGRPLVKDVERRVCAPCNNGWMSRLTQESKQALEPVLFGDPATIDTTDAEMMAKWIAMTIMTVEVGQRYPGVEPGERHQFTSNQRVPEDWRIWIARYNGHRWTASYHRHGAVVQYIDGSERASLAGFLTAIGNACFFAMAGSEPSPELEAVLHNEGFRSIHPTDGPLPWASLPSKSDDFLNQIADLITQEGDRNSEAVAATVK